MEGVVGADGSLGRAFGEVDCEFGRGRGNGIILSLRGRGSLGVAGRNGLVLTLRARGDLGVAGRDGLRSIFFLCLVCFVHCFVARIESLYGTQLHR